VVDVWDELVSVVMENGCDEAGEGGVFIISPLSQFRSQSSLNPSQISLHIKGSRHLIVGFRKWHRVSDQDRHLFDSDQSLPMDWLRGITWKQHCIRDLPHPEGRKEQRGAHCSDPAVASS
jgi:hypothetical protein